MQDGVKVDLFHPPQPRIPGVSEAKAEPPAPAPEPAPEPVVSTVTLERLRSLVPLMWIMLTVAGIVSAGAGLLLWGRKHAEKPAPVPDVSGSTLLGPAATSPQSTGGVPLAPGPVATTDELAKPWSSKQFLFRNPVTKEPVPSLVVRLPGGALWALSLREPYGDCKMEYVTSSEKLESQYRVRASHPMVADPCNGTVFDLSAYASGPNGLVRGEIVTGSAVRPPLAIEVQTKGKEIFATRSE